MTYLVTETYLVDLVLTGDSGVVSGMKMGNIVPREGIEPTFLPFQTNVLPLQYVGSLMSPLCST